MKKYKILIAILLSLYFTPWAAAQEMSSDEKVIIEALGDELNRSMESLKLENNKTPFYLSYAYRQNSLINLSASLGGLTSSVYIPEQSVGFLRILLGNAHYTSDRSYGGMSFVLRTPLKADYNALRYSFWMMSDIAYKSSVYNLALKESARKTNPPTSEVDSLNDYMPLEKGGTYWLERSEFKFDENQWGNNLVELSEIFKNYNEIFNSSVSLRGGTTVYYLVTSDNVKIRKTINVLQLVAQGSIYDNNGELVTERYVSSVQFPEELPKMEELKKHINSLAERIMKEKSIAKIDKQYSGPVMFEGGGVLNFFMSNLLYPGGIIATRIPDNSKTDLSYSFGKQIIDERISIKNITSLKEYNGTKLTGIYEVDAEGVIPPSELTLVNNGKLCSLLSGRVETLNAKKSTGSSRFCFNEKETLFRTAPGILHISTTKGIKQEKMKQELIKSAKSQGKEYAYIVRGYSEEKSTVYRIDIKSGNETKVNSAYISGLDLSRAKNLLAISLKESVINLMWEQVPISVIYPTSVIMNGVKISVSQNTSEVKSPLKNPAQR